MLGTLEPGDRLLVSELSRLGRSLSQVIQIVETLVRRKIRFIAIKEAIEFDGKQDLQTKVMIALFGLFAEVERDLISERTKEGLAAAKAKGKRRRSRHQLPSPMGRDREYSQRLDKSGGSAALHPDHHVRDVPVPARSDTGHLGRRVCR